MASTEEVPILPYVPFSLAHIIDRVGPQDVLCYDTEKETFVVHHPFTNASRSQKWRYKMWYTTKTFFHCHGERRVMDKDTGKLIAALSSSGDEVTIMFRFHSALVRVIYLHNKLSVGPHIVE
jgi:hypothetical protein